MGLFLIFYKLFFYYFKKHFFTFSYLKLKLFRLNKHKLLSSDLIMWDNLNLIPINIYLKVSRKCKLWNFKKINNYKLFIMNRFKRSVFALKSKDNYFKNFLFKEIQDIIIIKKFLIELKLFFNKKKKKRRKKKNKKKYIKKINRKKKKKNKKKKRKKKRR